MATAGPLLLERIVFAHLRLRAAPGHAPAVAEQLARWPQASTIRLTDDSSDVYALVVGVDHTILVAEAHERVKALPAVEEMQLNTVLETLDVGRAARLDSLSRRQVSELRSSRVAQTPVQTARLAGDDFELIHHLLCDGRMEIAELAARTGREPSVVSRRVARLLRDEHLDVVAIAPDSASSAPLRAIL